MYEISPAGLPVDRFSDEVFNVDAGVLVVGSEKTLSDLFRLRLIVLFIYPRSIVISLRLADPGSESMRYSNSSVYSIRGSSTVNRTIGAGGSSWYIGGDK